MDDRELNAMLREWKSPEAPARLRESVFPRQSPWWVRMWRAQLRVPVPLAVCLIVLLILGLRLATRQPEPNPVRLVTFRELQPVKELKPRIIRRQYE